MTLFRQFFRAQFKGLLIWVAVGALFALTGTRAAGPFVTGNSLAAMPKSLLDVLGDIAGLNNVDAYLALLIGKGTLLIPGLYAVMAALSVVTREVDRRTVEFLLALPVQRTQVLVARSCVLAVNIMIVVAAIWAPLRFDMAGQGFAGSWSHLNLVFVNIGLLALALGALTLAASMWIDDYSVGVKLCLGAVTSVYFAEYIMKAAHVSRVGRFFSPFSYVNVTDTLRTGSIAAGDVIVLAAVIAVGLAISFWAFNRKQFSA